MPRTKLGDHVKRLKNPRQPILEMIVGRYHTANVSVDELGEAMGLKEGAVYKRLKQPIEEWSYGEIIGACRCLSISTEELREKIRV